MSAPTTFGLLHYRKCAILLNHFIALLHFILKKSFEGAALEWLLLFYHGCKTQSSELALTPQLADKEYFLSQGRGLSILLFHNSLSIIVTRCHGLASAPVGPLSFAPSARQQHHKSTSIKQREQKRTGYVEKCCKSNNKEIIPWNSQGISQ